MIALLEREKIAETREQEALRLREKEVLRLREDFKLKYRDIGYQLGLSAGRVREIYLTACVHRRNSDKWEKALVPLNTRNQTLKNLQVITHLFYSRALSLEYRLPDPFVDELI